MRWFALWLGQYRNEKSQYVQWLESYWRVNRLLLALQNSINVDASQKCSSLPLNQPIFIFTEREKEDAPTPVLPTKPRNASFLRAPWAPVESWASYTLQSPKRNARKVESRPWRAHCSPMETAGCPSLVQSLPVLNPWSVYPGAARDSCHACLNSSSM